MHLHSDGYQFAFPGVSWRFGHSGDPDREHWAGARGEFDRADDRRPTW